MLKHGYASSDYSVAVLRLQGRDLPPYMICPRTSHRPVRSSTERDIPSDTQRHDWAVLAAGELYR